MAKTLYSRAVEIFSQKMDKANVPADMQQVIKGWADVFFNSMKEAQRELSKEGKNKNG